MVHVVGEILVDIFTDGNIKEMFPGGAPFNVANNIAYFGGSVSFYGCVGKDKYGLYLKKFSKKSNIHPFLLKTAKNRYTTQALVSLNNGERTFKFIRDNGADYFLRLNNLEKLNIEKGDIVHLGSLMLSHPKGRNFFKKAIKYAKDKGALISFDLNYRDEIFISQKNASRILKNAIKYVDILKISNEELKFLSPRKKLESSVKYLVNKNQIAFISRGPLGSCAYVHDTFVFQESKIVDSIDTTGAGDAFYSYILYELDKDKTILNNINRLKAILLRANVVGAFATLKKGAINVVPSIEQLNSILIET